MKRITLLTLVTVLFVSTAFAGEWVIDPAHSNIGFTVKHMMVSTVHGNFEKYTAKVVYDDVKPENSIFEATIDANSVNTQIAQRDKHLRSPDFFDVEKFPTLSFKSKKVESLGNGKLKVTGDLTIRNVTKEIVLEGEGFTPVVKGMQGKMVTAAHAEATINRYDYGLKYNAALEAGGVVVSNEIKIILDLELGQK